MPADKKWGAWAVAALLAAGGWVYVHVYLLAAETGGAFPRYSSLRADPAGTKVLHDALAALPGYEVRRWFRPAEELKDAGAVFLVLNDSPLRWLTATQKQLTGVEEMVTRGLRMAIVLNAAPGRLPVGPRLLQSRWGVTFVLPKEPEAALSLRVLDPAWTVFRGGKDKAVAIERAWGKGSLVLVAGSFPLSNEGLRDKRDQALLAWMLGPRHTVVFDEYHLGTEQTGSVGTLLRHFHLEAAAGVLALLGILFVWRNSQGFLPPAAAASETTVSGRDSAAAMTSLLRRSIPPAALPAAALELWRKSRAIEPGVTLEKRRRVEQELVSARGGDAAVLWRRIHEILTTRT